MTINIGGDSSYPVYLNYRLRDNPDNPELFDTVRMSQSANKDGVFEGTVPGQFFGELGFQYYVSAGSSTDRCSHKGGCAAN